MPGLMLSALSLAPDMCRAQPIELLRIPELDRLEAFFLLSRADLLF